MPEEQYTIPGMIDRLAEAFGDDLFIIHNDQGYIHSDAVQEIAEGLVQAAVALALMGQNESAKAYLGVAQALGLLIKAGAENVIMQEIVKSFKFDRPQDILKGVNPS